MESKVLRVKVIKSDDQQLQCWKATQKEESSVQFVERATNFFCSTCKRLSTKEMQLYYSEDHIFLDEV